MQHLPLTIAVTQKLHCNEGYCHSSSTQDIKFTIVPCIVNSIFTLPKRNPVMLALLFGGRNRYADCTPRMNCFTRSSKCCVFIINYLLSNHCLLKSVFLKNIHIFVTDVIIQTKYVKIKKTIIA